MREHKDIREELENISPFLANLKRQEDGFKVPDGYFDNFENNIFARIKAEEEVESWGSAASDSTEVPPQSSWLNKLMNIVWKPQVGIGFAMLLVVGFSINMLTQPTSSQSELASDEASEYIEENIEQFSQTLILEVMEEDWADLTETELTPDLDFSEDELEDYIEENLIDDLDNALIEEIL